jgi:hypothetical protein
MHAILLVVLNSTKVSFSNTFKRSGVNTSKVCMTTIWMLLVVGNKELVLT